MTPIRPRAGTAESRRELLEVALEEAARRRRRDDAVDGVAFVITIALVILILVLVGATPPSA